MLNWIFLLLMGSAVLTAAFRGTMPEVTSAGIASAKSAVELAIGLVGQMALWLGFMGILREAGLMRSIARALKPVMTRLFPDVPPEHPAMSAMMMNLSANVLGLGNAATPFGLKAMTELQKLNRHPGVATNAMALFLAINTAGVAVLPLGVIAVRATLGSQDAAGITLPSLLATSMSTAVAILVIKLTEKLPRYAPERFASPSLETSGKEQAAALGPNAKALAEAEAAAAPVAPAQGWRKAAVLAVLAALLAALGLAVLRTPPDQRGFALLRSVMSDWLLPLLMLTIVIFGFGRKVKVYEAFVSAAKEGFHICVTIIPFLVAILVAIGMFRASGAMEAVVRVVGPLTAKLGFPAEALPMAFIRPLSGSGALAVMTETMKTHGPDSFVGYLVSVINGSTETTFYVLALYFGSVGVKELRHTLLACLAADIAGVSAAAALCHLFFPFAT